MDSLCYEMYSEPSFNTYYNEALEFAVNYLNSLNIFDITYSNYNKNCVNTISCKDYWLQDEEYLIMGETLTALSSNVEKKPFFKAYIYQNEIDRYIEIKKGIYDDYLNENTETFIRKETMIYLNVICHELAHPFGLSDYNDVSELKSFRAQGAKSIMDYDNENYNFLFLQECDVFAIMRYYEIL